MTIMFSLSKAVSWLTFRILLSFVYINCAKIMFMHANCKVTLRSTYNWFNIHDYDAIQFGYDIIHFFFFAAVSGVSSSSDSSSGENPLSFIKVS